MTSKSYTVEDRHDDGTMADTTFLLTTTARCREVEATTEVAGGDGIAHHPGPWREVRLNRALSISVMAVGPSRLDLETAALGPLQPPSMGQDWEPPQRLSDNSATIFLTHHTDNTYDGYLRQLELPQTESAKQLVCFTMVLVSIGEGRTVRDALYYIFSINTLDHTTTGYHGQLEVLEEDPAKQPVSLITAVSVSMGEGEIVETDVRRPSMPPYITLMHSCHVVTTTIRLTSS